MLLTREEQKLRKLLSPLGQIVRIELGDGIRSEGSQWGWPSFPYLVHLGHLFDLKRVRAAWWLMALEQPGTSS